MRAAAPDYIEWDDGEIVSNRAVVCPYCKSEHIDDLYEFGEGLHEFDCDECERVFALAVSFSVSYKSMRTEPDGKPIGARCIRCGNEATFGDSFADCAEADADLTRQLGERCESIATMPDKCPRERRRLHVWGAWDAAPRYADAVKYPTQEEAVEALRGYDEEGTAYVPLGDKPVTKRMYDCEFDGPAPCDDPNCRHGHDALVWEFEALPPDLAEALGVTEDDDDA